MTMYFFYPIQQSAQQIYHTALPLLPLSSSLYRINQDRIPRNQTYVTGFLGAPFDWGLLLTTISAGPRRPTAIATFAEKIAVACEDVVNIYDGVTFALEKSLRIPQPAARIQGSKDGSVLYSTHSRSVASWDIQTGGLIVAFGTRSEINDTVVSQTDGHIACHLSDGSVQVVFRNSLPRKEVNFRRAQPVVAICWWSPAKLAVVTTKSIHTIDADTGVTSGGEKIPGAVWGMVVSGSGELMVGISDRDGREAQEACTSCFIEHTFKRNPSLWDRPGFPSSPIAARQTPIFHGQLRYPMYVENNITCITPPNGVQVFDTERCRWTKPPLLEKAKSLAVSLDRNLVVQTEDSVQIFSLDVLGSETAGKDEELSHMYPLGEKHAVCLRIDRRLAILELETLRILHPHVVTLLPKPSPREPPAPDCESSGRGLVAEFGVSTVVQAWRSLASLPRWAEGAEEDAILGGSSPMDTRIATLYGLPVRELRVKEGADGTILAKLPLDDGCSEGKGVAYGLTFDSETKFHLKVDGSGYHLKIPYDIIPSPSGRYPYTIKRGEPAPLSQPRATPPYTLDAGFEWVLDGESRRICWIPPDIMWRGSGGHFWVGPSLVMLGSDSVVRKLTFKDPDC